MGSQIIALPRAARGHLLDDGCVETEPLHDGPVAQLVRWHCRYDGEALRSERHHTRWVVGIVRRGASVVHDGSRSATVDPATAVLHRPGAAYFTTHPFGFDDSGWNLAFRDDVVDDALARAGIDLRGEPASLTVSSRPMLPVLHQLVFVERRRAGRSVDPLELEELCVELLDAVLDSMRRTRAQRRRRATTRKHARIVDEARQYLNVAYRGAVSLDDVCCAVGTSPAHLCRVFKSGTGISMRRYIHRLRLAAAADELVRGNASLARVAVGAGFSSHSHLSSICKRELGLQPSAIRRLACGIP